MEWNELKKDVDRCVEDMLERYDVEDRNGRLFFALGYMDGIDEIKALLWAIANGEKLIEG